MHGIRHLAHFEQTAGSAAGRLGRVSAVMDAGTDIDALVGIVAPVVEDEAGGRTAPLVNTHSASGLLTFGVMTTSNPISRKRRASLRAVLADCGSSAWFPLNSWWW